MQDVPLIWYNTSMIASAESLLKLVHQDGYCVGRTVVILRGWPRYFFRPRKERKHWVIVADDPDRGAGHLLEQVGWDVDDA